MGNYDREFYAIDRVYIYTAGDEEAEMRSDEVLVDMKGGVIVHQNYLEEIRQMLKVCFEKVFEDSVTVMFDWEDVAQGEA